MLSAPIPTAPSLAEHFDTLSNRFLTGCDFLERVSLPDIYIVSACIVIVLLSLLWWAGSRSSRQSKDTPLTPIISRYEAIKPANSPDLTFASKAHRDIGIPKRTRNCHWAGTMKFLGHLSLGLLGFYSLVNAFNGNIKHVFSRDTGANSSSALVDFQVYKPVEFDPASKGCSQVLLLMDHEFAYSYGKPYIGNYVPPQCDFDTVRINLTVTSQGRQFDRLALMYLNDTEVFRTSTAEPTTNGIIWTYIKEMSQYLVLWKSPQKIIFDLGNLIDSTYTGPFNVTLTASFTKENNGRVADVILPISSRQSAKNGTSAFTVPPDNATVSLSFPKNAQRAVVSISACGQIGEEFWWSNVLSQDVWDFNSTVGQLYGYSPFREIQLLIDGKLAGVVWPFPVIFTGGVAPGFWRPIVGIDTFDLREPEIDISPFLPLLTDGKPHTFQIKIVGLNTPSEDDISISDTVGSYWVVTGKAFIYLDDGENYNKPPSRVPPTIETPDPRFGFTRNLVYNATSGQNETLSYSVTVHRVLKITSGQNTWTQSLSYSNDGFFNQDGLSQRNIQNTTGLSISSGIGLDGKFAEYYTAFSYPIDVNTTYGVGANYTTIDAIMDRGLEISSTGALGISTYTLVSGPMDLQTRQWGDAHYYGVTGGPSYSSGDTSDEFHETSDGSTFSTYVHAINGTVVSGNGLANSPSLIVQGNQYPSGGRPSIRSIIGRGPGN